jgi:hypothetical protein
MGRYRRRPTEVDAVRLTWKTLPQVCEFLEAHGGGEQIKGLEIPWSEASDADGEDGAHAIAIDVTTVHGDKARVRHGDWIIAEDMPGRFYPCKSEVFADTYDAVGEDHAWPGDPEDALP